MGSVVRANIDLSNRAKTNFKVGQVLYRMTPGAANPVARYYVAGVLAKDTYKLQTFDADGNLLKQPIVATPDRIASFYLDPVATKLFDRIRLYEEGHEKSL